MPAPQLFHLFRFDDFFEIIGYVRIFIAVDNAAYLSSYAMSINFAGHRVKPVYISAVGYFLAFGQLCDPVLKIFHVICLSGFLGFPSL